MRMSRERGVEKRSTILAGISLVLYASLLLFVFGAALIKIISLPSRQPTNSPSSPVAVVPRGERKRIILGGVWCEYVRPAIYLCDLKKNGPTWETEGK